MLVERLSASSQLVSRRRSVRLGECASGARLYYTAGSRSRPGLQHDTKNGLDPVIPSSSSHGSDPSVVNTGGSGERVLPPGRLRRSLGHRVDWSYQLPPCKSLVELISLGSVQLSRTRPLLADGMSAPSAVAAFATQSHVLLSERHGEPHSQRGIEPLTFNQRHDQCAPGHMRTQGVALYDNQPLSSGPPDPPPNCAATARHPSGPGALGLAELSSAPRIGELI
jgi:hypothetical protein